MIVAPSVLSLDYSRFESQVKEVNESGAKYLHFDVMDGHFVPNLTFGPDLLKGFRKASPLFMDVHLMVDDPVYFTDVFLDAGADGITFHQEAVKDPTIIKGLSAHIRSLGKQAGICIKPKTALADIKPYLKDFDLFLVMSVEPGFGGQSFMPDALSKIQELRTLINQENPKALIEVDGGINAETGAACVQAGADILVAGSYIFHSDSISEAVKSLCPEQ